MVTVWLSFSYVLLVLTLRLLPCFFPLFAAWVEMIDGARTSINAAVFYMTLLGGEVDGQIILRFPGCP
jgi:hypothetical protein